MPRTLSRHIAAVVLSIVPLVAAADGGPRAADGRGFAGGARLDRCTSPEIGVYGAPLRAPVEQEAVR
jgi:hypothetical protein